MFNENNNNLIEWSLLGYNHQPSCSLILMKNYNNIISFKKSSDLRLL